MHLHTVGSSFHSKASACFVTWKCSVVCFLGDAVLFSFPCKNPCSFTSMTTWLRQQCWRLTDNFGFNNSVDNWHGEYSTASPLCMCNSRFRQRTLIVLCIQYSWTESWTCIVRPSTLQFHLAAMQRSSLFQAISLVRPDIYGPWVVDCKSSTICNVSHKPTGTPKLITYLW